MFGLLGYGLLLVGIVYFDKRRDLKTGGRWGGSGRGQRQQRTACSHWGRATLDALQDLEDGCKASRKREGESVIQRRGRGRDGEVTKSRKQI